MCCILSIFGSVMSNLLYFSEKFLYCFTCAALVSCLVTTLFVTLGMGIGLGYNYCYVDYKTKHRYFPPRYYKHKPTPYWKRSAPTDFTVSGVTVNNDLRTADASIQISTINKNETVAKHTYKEDTHNNVSFGTTQHMREKNNQVIEVSAEKTTEDSPKMIIPISGLDLIALLSKLRSDNRNYSLQIVTT